MSLIRDYFPRPDDARSVAIVGNNHKISTARTVRLSTIAQGSEAFSPLPQMNESERRPQCREMANLGHCKIDAAKLIAKFAEAHDRGELLNEIARLDVIRCAEVEQMEGKEVSHELHGLSQH